MRRVDLRPLFEFANRIASEKRVNRTLGLVSFDGPMTLEDERKFLEQTVLGMEAGDTASVTAWHEGEMVGNCDITRRKFADVRHTGTLGIVLDKRFRGVGLGEAMMRDVIRQAKQAGITLVELSVFAGNGRAIALYRKLGFKAVGTVPGKIHRGKWVSDEFYMYRKSDVGVRSISARRRSSRRPAP